MGGKERRKVEGEILKDSRTAGVEGRKGGGEIKAE